MIPEHHGSSSLFVPRESFRDTSEQRRSAQDEMLHAEQHILDIVYASKKSKVMYAELSEKAQHSVLSLDEGLSLAVIESCVLLNNEPRLLAYNNIFPGLYRTLRAYELSAWLERGNDTLLVGSGRTIPEVLALYIKAPNEDETTSFFEGASPKDFKDHVHFLNTQEGFEETPPYNPQLLEGTAIAIEPNTEIVVGGAQTRKKMGIPGDKVSFCLATLGDFLENRGFEVNVDTVLWNRLDPYIIFGDHVPSLLHKFIMRKKGLPVVSALFDLVKPGGQAIFSVGRGNSLTEWNDRDLFMRDLDTLLLDNGVPSSGVNFSEKSQLLGLDSYGVMQALAALKKDIP